MMTSRSDDVRCNICSRTLEPNRGVLVLCTGKLGEIVEARLVMCMRCTEKVARNLKDLVRLAS